MLAAPAPLRPAPRPADRPSPREVQATWAAILLSLGAFWYGFGVVVNALWNAFVG